MRRWVAAIAIVSNLTSSVRNGWNHVIAAHESMNLRVNSGFTNIFFGSHETDTNKLSRVSLETIEVVCSSTSRKRIWFNHVIIGYKSMNFLIDSLFTNILHLFRSESKIRRMC
jgi:hypothetical protein